MLTILEKVITHHKGCFFICLGLTLVFATSLFQIRIDDGSEALVDYHSAAYKQYKTYLKRFGSDRSVFIAVTTGKPMDDGPALRALIRAVEALKELRDVVDVHSALDLASVHRRGGRLVPRPLVSEHDSQPVLDHELLNTLRSTWPFVNQFVSNNGQVYGLLVRLGPMERRHLEARDLLVLLEQTVSEAFKDLDIELHMTGSPVFMEAISRYNVVNALLFVFCAGLVGMVVEWYIFKNLVISLFIYAISAVAAIWGMGLMALMGMVLNPVSGLAFGMVIVFSTMTVTHVVTHFYDHIQAGCDRSAALNEAVAVVGRPGLICALTTAVGFASLIISPVPTIRQFGVIMAVGALLSFAVVYLMLPFILLHLKQTVPGRLADRDTDLLTRGYKALGGLTRSHPRGAVVIGLFLLIVFIIGIPRIQVDTQFLSLFHDTSPEVVDYKWIQKQLGTPDPIHVVLTADPQKPSNFETLRTFKNMESRLLNLPGVEAGHSFFRVLETVYAGIFGDAHSAQALYKNTFLFQHLYRRVLSDPAARNLLGGCLDADSKSFCISLRPGDLMPHELDDLLGAIEATVSRLMPPGGQFCTTGALVVGHSQSKQLVRAQVYSLCLALFLVSILLMIQFKSWRLGVLSMIPNVFPLIALFGVMGWAGIPLDNVTIMVAVISIGLSVDDTIHFFSQFRAGLSRLTVIKAVSQAYQISAKALITTSAVLVLAFCALIWSPFKPTASFGMLAAVAAFTALIADLVFMPALIYGSKWARRLIAAGFNERCKASVVSKP